MKKLLIVSLLSAILIVSLGCGGTTYPWSIEQHTEKMENDPSVLLSVESDSLSVNGARFRLQNAADRYIAFGAEYRLQILQGSIWYDIDIGTPDWTAEEYLVAPGDEFSMDVEWYSLYGELPAGTYRFVKDFRFTNEDAQNLNDASVMICSFDIQ